MHGISILKYDKPNNNLCSSTLTRDVKGNLSVNSILIVNIISERTSIGSGLMKRSSIDIGSAERNQNY